MGRTGSYLAIDYLLEETQQNSTVDVVKCISFLRSYRMNLVETEVGRRKIVMLRLQIS